MKNAIVTGASSGIGRATALALARRGWAVALVARRAGRLEEVASAIASGGGRALVAPADVADREQVARAVVLSEAAHGPTDLLVGSAGIPGGAAFAEAGLDGIERVMRVNYLGTVAFMVAVLPGMIERGRGHIVSVSSVAGRVAVPGSAAYTASKFALTGLFEALGAELPRGIRVSLVNPGPIETEGFPHPELAGSRLLLQPEVVARALVRAVEHVRAEVSVPRWYGVLPALRLAPPLYRLGLRMFAARFRPTPGA